MKISLGPPPKYHFLRFPHVWGQNSSYFRFGSSKLSIASWSPPKMVFIMILWGLGDQKLIANRSSAHNQWKSGFFVFLSVSVLLDGKNVPQLAIMSAKRFPLLLSIILTHLIDLCNKKYDQPGLLDRQGPWEVPAPIWNCPLYGIIRGYNRIS